MSMSVSPPAPSALPGFHWPSQIAERPLLAEIKGSTCTFKDGFSCDVDIIIMCTGYLHHYPFLSDNLRLTCPNVLYPPCLYKGVVWTEAANGKLLYVGAQDQYYTYTMFDAQGCWVAKYIVGDIKIPDPETMKQDCKSWIERNKNLKDCHDEIKFQTDYINELAAEANYGFDIDVAAMFDEWEGDKHDNILTYRDKCFVSKFTGNKSPCHHTTFMKAFDDSIATYVSQEE